MTSFAEMFDNAVETGFGPSDDLVPGKYIASIVTTNVGTSKAEDPQYGFLFKATDHEKNGEQAGDTMWLNLTLSEAAKDYAIADLKNLGVTGAQLDADPGRAIAQTVGQVWSVEVKLSKDEKWTNLYLGKRKDAAAVEKSSPASPAAEQAEEAPEAPAPSAAPAEDDVWNM